MIEKGIVRELPFTKSTDWLYEQEFRVIASDLDKVPLGIKFNKESLIEINMGCQVDKIKEPEITKRDLLEVLKKVNYPIIMKFPKGTQGKGVMVADSFAGASSLLDALDFLKQPFIIQEFIETDGSDVRAIVIGDKVVASMARRAKEDEKRANIHAGGKGEAITLDSHTKKIAIDTAKVLKTLMEINYQGAVSLEFDKDKEDPLPGVAESIGYIKGVLSVI